jgi:hypothetical protein
MFWPEMPSENSSGSNSITTTPAERIIKAFIIVNNIINELL